MPTFEPGSAGTDGAASGAPAAGSAGNANTNTNTPAAGAQGSGDSFMDKSGAPAGTDTKTPATPAAGDKTKSIVPQKFLNKDGTPNLENFAKSYEELEQWRGAHVRTEPKTIDDYKYETKNKEFTWDEKQTTAFKEYAKDTLQMSTEQYNKLMDYYEKNVTEQTKVAQEAAKGKTWTKDKVTEYLKKEWGSDFDKKQRDTQVAADVLFPNKKFFEAHPELKNHPGVIQLLANLGQHMSEDSSLNDGQQRVQSGMSQDEVKNLMREQMKKGTTKARYKEIDDQLNQWFEANPEGLYKNIYESAK